MVVILKEMILIKKHIQAIVIVNQLTVGAALPILNDATRRVKEGLDCLRCFGHTHGCICAGSTGGINVFVHEQSTHSIRRAPTNGDMSNVSN